jgi:LacI family xylobiose transport system transcriptional regulator
MASTGSMRGRRTRGEIEQLPSGSLRVRVYAGIDQITRKRHYLVGTVPAGKPKARPFAARLVLLHHEHGRTT